MKSTSCLLLCAALLLTSLLTSPITAHAAFFRHAAPALTAADAAGTAATAQTSEHKSRHSFWASLRHVLPAHAGKSQLAAVVLCFVAGSLGAHRFYMGYKTIGIVQLLTFGGLGIWALVDFIRLLTGDLQPKGSTFETEL